jgi:hypothetical protein
VLIGGNANDTNPLVATEILDGRIDDVRLYTRALSASEISALASGQAPTAVALRTFSARPAGSFVELNWQTTQEAMLLGFNPLSLQPRGEGQAERGADCGQRRGYGRPRPVPLP